MSASPTSSSGPFGRELRAEIEIDAPPQTVWQALTATDDYSWNPFIHRLEGRLARGEKLEVEIEPPDGRAMTFKPTVLEVEEETKLRWLGRLLLPRVFDGEHSFELEPLENGGTRFIQSERFSGLLVGLFSGTLDKTQRGFEAMNDALKRRAEASGLG